MEDLYYEKLFNIKTTGEQQGFYESHHYNRYEATSYLALETLFKEYEFYLHRLLEKAPRYTSNINVLLKSLDQFNDKITSDEMKFIWSTIDKYKNGYVPFSVPLYLVKSYIIRFDLNHLVDQTFFMPYPEDLVLVNDSGKLIH